MNLNLCLGSGAAALLLAASSAHAVPSLSYSLGDPTYAGNQAVLEVFVDYDADTSAPTPTALQAGLVFLQLDVSLSDPSLQGPLGANDFRRFGYSGPLALDAWTNPVTFGPDSSVLMRDLDTDTNPGSAIPDGATGFIVGRLVVDLTGLTPGSTLWVRLGAPTAPVSFAGFEDPVGDHDSFDFVYDNGNGARALVVPEPTVGAVPEPLTAGLAFLGLGATAFACRRRR